VRWQTCGSTRHLRAPERITAFVVSLNLHRRHLSESQRGMVAAKLETLEHGGNRRCDQDANLHVEPVTRAKAAELLNVSTRTVAAAAKVKDAGRGGGYLQRTGNQLATRAGPRNCGNRAMHASC